MKLSALVPLAHGMDDPDIAGLTADSREIAPGFAFFAIAGGQLDGTRFAENAVQRGAAAVIAPRALPLPVPVIVSHNPRIALARAAAAFYAAQPATTVAITGTNGKTSTAAFLRQIWAAQGHASASIGTVGVVSETFCESSPHTTPHPVALHRALACLADEGVTHCAIEASSHGLAQHRVDAVDFAAAGFSNITRDHLDYHHGFEDYFGTKLRLFGEVLQPGRPAIICTDSPEHGGVIAAARARGAQALTVGPGGNFIALMEAQADGLAQHLTLTHAGREWRIHLPLAGAFQAANALLAAGLAIATGTPPQVAFPALERLEGAKGRLELIGRTAAGAPVFVDYAHTSDALAKALETLRPYASGRLAVVFGCGGDRDAGKRPQMGEVAARLADRVIVTDDNPRSEPPDAIRAAILAAAPGAEEIGDRASAIHAGIAGLAAGDVLLIAGKGHETGQIVGDRTLPFSDHDVARAALGLA